MRRVCRGLIISILCSSFLFGNEGSSDVEYQKAMKEIEKLNELQKQQSEKKRVIEKSESQLKAEKEIEDKKNDMEKQLDIYIYQLRKIKKDIDLKYVFVDIETLTIGKTKYSINEEEYKRALKYLKDAKELKITISSFLSTISSSKNIESRSFLTTSYNDLREKILQFDKKYSEQSDAYAYRNNTKRVLVSDGLVVNNVYATRVGEYLEITIK